MVANIWKGLFACGSYISLTINNHFVGWSVGSWMFLSPGLDVLTRMGDSVSGETTIFLNTRVRVISCWCSLGTVSEKLPNFLFRSILFDSIDRGFKCICTIFFSGCGEDFLSMYPLMNVVPNKTFTARFSITPNHFFPCRSPICTNNEILLMKFLACFVTFRTLDTQDF